MTFRTPSWIALPQMGFDWVWFLSVWQTGPAGQRVSRTNPEWRREFQETLPDLREEDIAGFGFRHHRLHRASSSSEAMRRWPGCASGCAQRGLRLLLDFVPNHTGLDHPWVEEHPEYYIQGTELDLARAPQNYTWVKRSAGRLAARPRARSVLSRAGRTRCSSTTATRPRRKR